MHHRLILRERSREKEAPRVALSTDPANHRFARIYFAVLLPNRLAVLDSRQGSGTLNRFAVAANNN
jgi:hypothetical protein